MSKPSLHALLFMRVFIASPKLTHTSTCLQAAAKFFASASLMQRVPLAYQLKRVCLSHRVAEKVPLTYQLEFDRHDLTCIPKQ